MTLNFNQIIRFSIICFIIYLDYSFYLQFSLKSIEILIDSSKINRDFILKVLELFTVMLSFPTLIFQISKFRKNSEIIKIENNLTQNLFKKESKYSKLGILSALYGVTIITSFMILFSDQNIKWNIPPTSILIFCLFLSMSVYLILEPFISKK